MTPNCQFDREPLRCASQSEENSSPIWVRSHVTPSRSESTRISRRVLCDRKTERTVTPI
jgi:hypothetical protein